jgi:hypothetical protein
MQGELIFHRYLYVQQAYDFMESLEKHISKPNNNLKTIPNVLKSLSRIEFAHKP